MSKKKGSGILMRDNEFSTTIQLSHLLASQIGLSGDQALIIDAIYGYSEEVTEDNLHDIVANQFHVNMDTGRIHNAIIALVKANKLSQLGNTLFIAPDALEAINSLIEKNEQCEETAVEEWLKQYEDMIAQTLSDAEKATAKQCLLDFIRRFFLTHGADCYKLICGEKQTEYYDLNTIAQACSKAANDEKQVSLTHFLSGLFSNDLTGSQTNFLLNQLKKAVNYLSTVVDESTQSLLKKQIAGLTIYIDTTILYRLFNLQGEKRYQSTKKLIEFCQSANATLKVLQTTVEEMRRRIGYDSRVIIDHPTPVNFASIGYQCRTSENYISTFWSEQSRTGISAKDFNYRYCNIKLLLDDAGIEIDDGDYIADETILAEKSTLIGKVSQYGSTDPTYQKSPSAVDHDAECIAVIEHLQKKNTQTIIESQTAFLTTDWSLIRIQRNDYLYREKPDFAVLPSQMMQIFCMTAPTTNYLEAFMGLFSSSRTYFGTSALSNEQIQLIMGRVAYYKGATPAFAEKILTNQLIQTAFSAKETEDEQNDLIADAILEEVEGMEAALTHSSEELSKKAKQIDRIESEKEEKDRKIDDLGRRLTALEESKKSSEEQVSKYEKHIMLTARHNASRKAAIRFGGGILLLVIGAVLLFLVIASVIPPLAKIVLPVMNWMGTSATLEKESGINGTLITILLTIGISAVSAGVFLFRPGYKELKHKYEEKESVIITQ